jgi:hypothetical protein
MIKALLVAFGIFISLTHFAMAQTAPCPAGYICTIADTNSVVTSNGETTTNVNSPPPSAIAPGINLSNSDLCTVGVSGAVQTQILGISAGKTVRDMNCEKLKNAKTLYDMGMKVAAVATMCQDPRIFQSMMDAGTPCPYDGMIGAEAKTAWEANPDKIPGDNNGKIGKMDPATKSTVLGGGAILLLLLGLTAGI